ncbi:peptide chain release factor 2 [Candidatus Profftella armatura (Diaphorina cf. continua)]|uniref:Peptide chain release factor 2 n=1 Tax=Candidatus Profftella armatura (Diaphorina cf. continua) TaxID=2661583 RepID=A0A7R6VYH3_9PROT|nr:peptide chain release factor 2 [Candidatus Profftella armatura (Diaphorina cf. continua)]
MNYGNIFDFDIKFKKLNNINNQLESPNIWKNQEYIKKLSKEKKILEYIIFNLIKIENKISYNRDLFEIIYIEKEESMLKEIEDNINKLNDKIKEIEFHQFFNDPLDFNNCFINIQSGAGGVEAQDWAFMLLRQYLRYCERKGFIVEILEKSNGEIAGIKTATLKIKGKYAYGFLKSESGIHRLVRKSPFDSSNNRHTSFSSLFVYPEINNLIKINIDPSDLRIDTYRASGAGGQHINKTDSAVRITHIPTGIVVQCQNDRSQHRNKSEAWDMLKAKLYKLELQYQIKKKKKLEDSKTDIGWGYQIRSYILDQSRIKDLRTNLETKNIKAILDGDLDNFIIASLKQRLLNQNNIKPK